MIKFVSSIDEVDEICRTISKELDFPDWYYNSVRGEDDYAGFMYFRIRGNTFSYINLASIQPRLTFLKLDISNIFELPYREKDNELSISFGFDCTYWKLYWLLYRVMHIYSENSGSENIGCCSRFLECSNALQCLNPDKELRYSCQYRKNKFNGRIFYGENRNYF